MKTTNSHTNALLLHLLKVEGDSSWVDTLLSVFPFHPVLDISAGSSLGRMVFSCVVTIPTSPPGKGELKGEGTMELDLIDLKEMGILNVLRKINEDAIESAFRQRK